MIKRSSGPISRIPGGYKVADKAGVVQMGMVNDQVGQGRTVRVFEEISILSGRPGGEG